MTLTEIALALANSGPCWRPTADRITEELTAELRALYPKMPEGVAELSARTTVNEALKMATSWRAASGEVGSA